MIVTSKRCFLNVLTQICDVDTLLNATYYMADIKTPDGTVQLSDGLRYNDDGQLEFNTAMSTPAPAISRYNVTYGSELDPAPFITTLLCGNGTCDDPMEKFIQHLNSTDVLISVYNMLFKKELKGNGLQIIIFADEETVKRYVDVICRYLAHNFGCDITFIDPIYRPNVIGMQEYHGNKEFSDKNIKDLKDAQLIIGFNSAISQCCGDACANNLQSYLSSFNVPQLIYLYNLLWQDEPLPPDNYNADHMRTIIVGRVSSSIPKNPFDNITSTEDFMSMIRAYESEEEDLGMYS